MLIQYGRFLILLGTFLVGGTILGCDTHKPGTALMTGVNASASVSSSEIANQVSAQLALRMEQNAESQQRELTLGEKGEDLQAYLKAISKIFPGMTEPEKQKYALMLMEQHYGLPIPEIKEIGVEAKKGSPKTSKNTTTASELSKYPVFPNEDAGADPAISAQDGGRGFGAIAESLGYLTNTEYPLIGDSRALKGGSISYSITDYPSTLRPSGKESNTWLNYLALDLMYESLLMRHFTTMEWCPALATHWKISADQQTFWFRLNPNARWADGTSITAEDVVETWKLNMHPDLEEPSNIEVFGKYKEPQALSKYLVKVECAKPNWRNFLYISGLPILSSQELFTLSSHKSFDSMPWQESFRENLNAGILPDVLKAIVSKKLQDIHNVTLPHQFSLTPAELDNKWKIGEIGEKDIFFHYILNDQTLRIYSENKDWVKKWLREYNFKYMTQSGAYTADHAELEKEQGNKVIFRRRPDYWAKDQRRNIGCFNFDKLEFIVVRNSRASFEMAKAGQLDCYLMATSKWWIEDAVGEKFDRGLLSKKRFYNSAPVGTMGLAFNMKKPPYNDVRVRKALTLLIDRDELLQKLMYNQYEKENSYWPGGDYENKNNPKNEYNPNEALRLLNEAGWNERNSEGRLMKAGQPLDVELLYDSEGFEPHLTLIQNTYRKEGVNLILRRISPETRWQQVLNKEYDLSLMSWGAIDPPNPETSWKGTLADQPNNNNITAYKNSEVDQLIEEYDRMDLTTNQRIQIIQKIDGLIAQDYPYAMLWYGAFKRFIFWNKYGYPRGGMARLLKDDDSIFWLWWYDPAKDQKLQEAIQNPSLRLKVEEMDDRYWIDERKPLKK